MTTLIVSPTRARKLSMGLKATVGFPCKPHARTEDIPGSGNLPGHDDRADGSHLNREQRRALIAESLKADPGLSNREHERRTGTHKNTVQAVREELEGSGQIAHFEKRQDPRTGNLSQPASHPPRPEPEPEPELPQATALAQEDLDELNAEPPTWRPVG